MQFNFGALIPHALLLLSALSIADAAPHHDRDRGRTVTVVKYRTVTKRIPKTTIVKYSTRTVTKRYTKTHIKLWTITKTKTVGKAGTTTTESTTATVPTTITLPGEEIEVTSTTTITESTTLTESTTITESTTLTTPTTVFQPTTITETITSTVSPPTCAATQAITNGDFTNGIGGFAIVGATRVNGGQSGVATESGNFVYRITGSSTIQSFSGALSTTSLALCSRAIYRFSAKTKQASSGNCSLNWSVGGAVVVATYTPGTAFSEMANIFIATEAGPVDVRGTFTCSAGGSTRTLSFDDISLEVVGYAPA